jgi:hypothetical protein
MHRAATTAAAGLSQVLLATSVDGTFAGRQGFAVGTS